MITLYSCPLTPQKYSTVATDDENDEWLGNMPDDTDTIVLHRYFEKHADKIGKELLSQSKTSPEVDPTGKRAWVGLCAALVELGKPMDVPRLSPYSSAEHKEFLDLLSRYSHRNTDSVRDIFVETPVPKVSTFSIRLPISDCLHRINRPSLFCASPRLMSKP
jgi:hypothetical protein